MEQCTCLIADCLEQTASLDRLENILLLLRSLNPEQLSSLAKNCDLSKFFLSIDLTQPQLARIGLDLAKIIFSSINFWEFANQHHCEEVVLALRSGNQDLCSFILDKLLETDTKAALAANLVLPILEQLTSKSLSIANSAHKLLLKHARRFNDHSLMEREDILRFLRDSLGNCSSSVRVRIQEFLVELASLGEFFLERIMAGDMLKEFFRQLSTKDVLVQLNSLAILQHLATTPHGNHYLKEAGILDNLISQSEGLLDDPLACNLALPSFISFFCALQHHHFKDWLTNGKLLQLYRRILQDEQHSCYAVVIEGLAFVASQRQPICMQALDQLFAGELGQYLQLVGRHITQSTTEIRVRCLEAFTYIFQAGELDPLCWDITSTWFQRLASERPTVLLDRIFCYAKQPFPEIRLMAYKGLTAIASKPWGVDLLLQTAGLMEFMLNRATEEGNLDNKGTFLLAKLNFVEAMVHTHEICEKQQPSTGSGLLQPEAYLALRSYLKEGAWGVRKAEAAVAIQD